MFPAHWSVRRVRGWLPRSGRLKPPKFAPAFATPALVSPGRPDVAVCWPCRCRVWAVNPKKGCSIWLVSCPAKKSFVLLTLQHTRQV